MCDLYNVNSEAGSQTALQTDRFYPKTIVPQELDIPVTLAMNNYLYRENSHLNLVYHDIAVKVLDTYFDELYVAAPGIASDEVNQIYQVRARDNLGDLFQIRYATFDNSSCLGTNLIQFKMIFKKDDALYEYYFGNCNSSEVLYESFNSDSPCIPMDFLCYNDGFCDRGTYSLALEEARSDPLILVDKEDLHVTGRFPTSLRCLEDQSCTFTNFKTFNPEEASYTLVPIDSGMAPLTTSVASTLAQQENFPTSLTTANTPRTGSSLLVAGTSILYPPALSLIFLLVYILGL